MDKWTEQGVIDSDNSPWASPLVLVKKKDGKTRWVMGLSYLDDILVYLMDSWEHLEHLRKVVQAHTKAGIKIQPKKTKIFQSEVEYLGQEGVQMQDKYVKYVQN